MRSAMAATCSGVFPAPKTTSGQPGAELPGVVDGGEAEVLRPEDGEARPRVGGADLSVADGLQQGVDIRWVHGRNQNSRGRLTSSTG